MEVWLLYVYLHQLVAFFHNHSLTISSRNAHVFAVFCLVLSDWAISGERRRRPPHHGQETRSVAISNYLSQFGFSIFIDDARITQHMLWQETHMFSTAGKASSAGLATQMSMLLWLALERKACQLLRNNEQCLNRYHFSSSSFSSLFSQAPRVSRRLLLTRTRPESVSAQKSARFVVHHLHIAC